MKCFSRVTTIGLMALSLLALAVSSSAQQRDPIIDKIAKAYGLDSYDKIEAIRLQS